jgi:L-glyceraldehyde 3-phosphate reductase
MSSLDQSLKRMGLEYVDIFYSHRPDPETPLEETMGALHSAVQQGKALYVGISNYSAEQTREAARVLGELGTPLLIHQPRYSMLDRRPEDEGLLDALDELRVGSIVFSPLEQGLLTSRYLDGIPEDSRAASDSPFLNSDAVTEDLVAQLRELNDIAKSRGQTLAQMALAWVLRGDRVTSALVGASSPQQLEDSVGAIRTLDFDADELARIDAVING